MLNKKLHENEKKKKIINLSRKTELNCKEKEWITSLLDVTDQLQTPLLLQNILLQITKTKIQEI